MNDKIKRGVATGLLALMISNFAACQKTGLANSGNENTESLNSNPIKDFFGQLQEESSETGKSFNEANAPAWQIFKNDGTVAYGSLPIDKSDLRAQPLPIEFLQEEGILFYDNWNGLRIDDPKVEEMPSYHKPFASRIFINEATSENEIYWFVNYQDAYPVKTTYQDEHGCNTTTWILKYTLSDEDYQVFLKLKGDWRNRFFVQMIDKAYEPELLSKSITSQRILEIACPNKIDTNEVYSSLVFPNIFVANVEESTHTLTFGSYKDGKLKFIDFNVYNTGLDERAREEWKMTDEEFAKSIKFKYRDSATGSSIEMYVAAGVNCPNVSTATKFEASTRGDNLTEIGVNSSSNKFSYNDIIKEFS